MSGATTEVWLLGVIAASTAVMAVVQILVLIAAGKAVREATRRMQDVQRGLEPILANARKASEDAARVTALALTQVERVDRLVDTVTVRVDETFSALRDVVLGPLSNGSAVLAGLKAALSAFAARRRRSSDADGDDEEDDGLFIG